MGVFGINMEVAGMIKYPAFPNRGWVTGKKN